MGDGGRALLRRVRSFFTPSSLVELIATVIFSVNRPLIISNATRVRFRSIGA